ncbi:hypothetical protein LINGRAHAP2_LOCUS15983 [Linum grandiflorum]
MKRIDGYGTRTTKGSSWLNQHITLSGRQRPTTRSQAGVRPMKGCGNGCGESLYHQSLASLCGEQLTMPWPQNITYGKGNVHRTQYARCAKLQLKPPTIASFTVRRLKRSGDNPSQTSLDPPTMITC